MKIAKEIRARLPLYWSDYTDAFATRQSLNKVLAASMYILFTSIGPAITFSAFLLRGTHGQYGAIEVLLSTALSGIMFSLAAGQPIVIVGVTGPVSIFSETVYVLVERWFGGDAFLPFMFWVSLWAGVFHMTVASMGLCDWLKHVTRFSYELFGALIGVIYLYEAVKEIVGNSTSTDVGLLTVLIALGTLYLGTRLTEIRYGVLYNRTFRNILSDYAVPLTVVTMSAIYYAPALHDIPLPLLQVSPTFTPTNGRSTWTVDPFLNLPSYGVAVAILPGMILTLLFYFDHNVSSILAQEPRFNLRKPSAFNWDFFLLGISMLVSGILGLPPTNGLIPQAPLHVRSLAITTEQVETDPQNPHIRVKREVVVEVIEQRVSNLLQSILTGVCVLVPALLSLLGSVPVAVLNGLFLVMGIESFWGNQFMERLLILCFVTDKKHRVTAAPYTWPYIRHVRWKAWISFTLIQLCFLGLIFGITLTPAAICFPVFIVLLVPTRMFLLPKFFSRSDIMALDSDGASDAREVDGSQEQLENEPIDKNEYVVEIELDSAPGFHHQTVEVVDEE